MSLIPRRTNESGDGGSSKSMRASRIAQPTKRTATERSLERAFSGDRLRPSIPSSTRKTKQHATPLKTPNRQFSTNLNMVMTSEKKRPPVEDKRGLQLHINKIMHNLRKLESTLGKEFFRNGLKSMSTKQFLMVFSNFLTYVVGNRLVVGTNYVDDIPKILTQIEYPYNVLKSWLKTPAAPHAFNNIVNILSWLNTFVPDDNAISNFENEFLLPADDFPDKECFCNFVEKTREGFALWNNGKDDEFNNLKVGLIDGFIEKRTNIENLSMLENEIKKLKCEIDQIVHNKIVSSRENEYFTLDKEVKSKEKILMKLEELDENNVIKINQLKNSVDIKLKSINEIQKKIQDTKITIETQNFSSSDRDDLVTKINFLKQSLEWKKKSVCGLHDMGMSNQIRLSRFLNKKMEMISKFNNNLSQIFADYNDSEKINVKDLYLDTNSNKDIIEQVDYCSQFLKEKKSNNLEEFNLYFKLNRDLESELKMASYEYETVTVPTLESVMEKIVILEKDVEEIDIQTINLKNVKLKRNESFLIDLNKFLESNEEREHQIALKREELKQRQDENQAMMEKITAKHNEVLTYRRNKLQAVNNAVEKFNMILKKFTS